MTYEPHLIAVNLSYLLLVWFFIISAFGKDRDFAVSLVLCVLWGLYCLVFFFELFSPLSYNETLNTIILIDSAFALSCAMILRLSPSAWKHSLLLCFATFCHCMLLLSLKYDYVSIFYLWYDELIIMVGLLQMVISYNGFTKAFRNIQGLLHWRNANSDGVSSSLPTQKKRKAKA